MAAIKYFLQGKGAEKGLRWEEGRKDGGGGGRRGKGWRGEGGGEKEGGRVGEGEKCINVIASHEYIEHVHSGKEEEEEEERQISGEEGVKERTIERTGEEEGECYSKSIAELLPKGRGFQRCMSENFGIPFFSYFLPLSYQYEHFFTSFTYVHVCTHTQFRGANPERLVAAIKYFLQGKGAQKGLRWEEGRKDGEGGGGGEEGWGRGRGGEGWRGWEKGRRMGEGEEGKRMERGGRRGGRMEGVEGGEKDEGRVGEG